MKVIKSQFLITKVANNFKIVNGDHPKDCRLIYFTFNIRGGCQEKISQVTSSKVAISNVKHKSGKIIWLAHPVKVPTPTPHMQWLVCPWTKTSIFEFCLKPYHVSIHLKAYVAGFKKAYQKCFSLLNIYTMETVTAF